MRSGNRRRSRHNWGRTAWPALTAHGSALDAPRAARAIIEETEGWPSGLGGGLENRWLRKRPRGSNPLPPPFTSSYTRIASRIASPAQRSLHRSTPAGSWRRLQESGHRSDASGESARSIRSGTGGWRAFPEGERGVSGAVTGLRSAQSQPAPTMFDPSEWCIGVENAEELASKRTAPPV